MKNLTTSHTTMVPEWMPHERTWMSFPTSNDTFGSEGSETLQRARRAWTNVAQTIARYEPVTVVVSPGDADVATEILGTDIDVVYAPLDDAWIRDSGPTFVHGTEGQLVAVDWIFNGWGAQSWAAWEYDALLGRFVAEQTATTISDSPLVNEGGAFHVDGKGTVLLTETVQLDP